MEVMDKQESMLIMNELKQQYQSIVNKPFIVSVLGQTGVGKSSLINALFGTQLETSPVKPCTKEIEKVPVVNKKGFNLWFYDLPGLGESEEADAIYLEKYIECIKISDIILWAMSIDNRSVTSDSITLNLIMNRLEKVEQKRLFNRITFVLTKADILFQPPWIFSINKSDSGFFAANKELKNIFEQKCDYIQMVMSKTMNKNNIHENFRPVYCSSLFKYNLSKVLSVIIKKIEGETSLRISNFIDLQDIDTISLSQLRTLSNLIIFNQNSKQTIFDLSTLILDEYDK